MSYNGWILSSGFRDGEVIIPTPVIDAFLKLVGCPQEALLEAPFCNPFYFVFAVLAGWEVALGAGSDSFRTLDGLCFIVVQHWS